MKAGTVCQNQEIINPPPSTSGAQLKVISPKQCAASTVSLKKIIIVIILRRITIMIWEDLNYLVCFEPTPEDCSAVTVRGVDGLYCRNISGKLVSIYVPALIVIANSDYPSLILSAFVWNMWWKTLYMKRAVRNHKTTSICFFIFEKQCWISWI